MDAASRQRTQYRYIYFLRVAATLLVIMLHCVSPYVASLELFGTKTWWMSNIIGIITRAGVPLYFMMSGYLLLSREDTASFKQFYKKRLKRILAPFIIWDVAYFLYFSLTSGNGLSIARFLSELIDHGSAYHLWFLYTIAGIYLVAPFFKRLTDSLTNKQIMGLLAIMAFPVAVRPFINTVTPVYIFLLEPLFGGYLAFFILGCLLGRVALRPIARAALYVGGIAGVVVGSAGNYLLSSPDGLDLVFNGGYQLIHFFSATALFVFFKYSKTVEGAGHLRMAKTFSAATFSAYLSHVMVLDFLQRNVPMPTPAIAVLANFGATAIICFAFSLLVLKFKPLRQLLA